jgi:hypothetical protein
MSRASRAAERPSDIDASRLAAVQTKRAAGKKRGSRSDLEQLSPRSCVGSSRPCA